MGKGLNKKFRQAFSKIASYLMKLLMIYCMKLFFREVEVIEKYNIPKDGPVIVFGNHNNQFVDGCLINATIKRKIKFIAAAISVRRPFIGELIRATGAIPVERPQDLAKKGQGEIVKIEGQHIYGTNTRFKSIQKESLMKVGGQTIKIKQIISDVELIASTDKKMPKPIEKPEQYKIIPKIQFNQLYENVWKQLRDGSAITIFPQGGSHDKLQLQPLKAGICIMALGAMQKYGRPVTLVPVGFNYYNAHKFRSKAILEFGVPFTIPQQYVELYKKDQNKAVSELLQNVRQMLLTVTTSCRSFEQLSTLFLCRQLYTLYVQKQLTTEQKLTLNRRFSKGFDMLVGEPKLQELYKNLKEFNTFIKIHKLSIRKQNQKQSIMTDIVQFYFFLMKCIFRAIIAIPHLILLAPTISLIKYQAEKQRKREQKKANYEQQAKDVVGSYKIILSLIYFPLTTLFHMIILYLCLTSYTKISKSQCILICCTISMLLPFYAFWFVKSYDSLGKNFRKLNILFQRFFKRSVYEEFQVKKRHLSKQIVKLVNEYGNQVIPDFEFNRILKEDQVMSHSQKRKKSISKI